MESSNLRVVYMTSFAAFDRIIGIDYSGARTPTSSLKTLRIYMADPPTSPPTEVLPPPGPNKYWTRNGIATWLVAMLSHDCVSLVGIDHGFSFPLRYFETHLVPPDWSTFLDDFHAHWPTDDDHTYVDFVRDGHKGYGDLRAGHARWRRLTEKRAGAKSVFHFDIPGSVAKSTHAGLPWLRYLRDQTGQRIHFWPFDGWIVPEGKSVVAEIYPSLWSALYPTEGRTPDQHDAWTVVERLRGALVDGCLLPLFQPTLTPEERLTARVEGWILGVL